MLASQAAEKLPEVFSSLIAESDKNAKGLSLKLRQNQVRSH